MGKKRFFDDRLKYLSFIQNTGEKKAISEKIYSHIANLSQNKSYLRVLDAGTGDGTIFSNIVKSFHRFHPYTSLLITGKEVSYEDLKNTLDKTPDRFVEHPNLLITMSNVKFSELGSIESSNKIKEKGVKKLNLVLKSDNSYDFNSQISGAKLGNFIKKNWGIEIDNRGILKSKQLLNKQNINKMNFLENQTGSTYAKRSFIYGFLSSVRQKINDPLGKKRNK